MGAHSGANVGAPMGGGARAGQEGHRVGVLWVHRPPSHALGAPTVVGRRERERGTVSVRSRNNRQLGERDLHWVLRRLRELCDTRVPDAEEQF